MRPHNSSIALATLLLASGCTAASESGPAVSETATRTSARPRAVPQASDWDAAAEPTAVQHVLLVSVDGMGSVYIGGPMSHGRFPTLQKFRDVGSSTLNARTDYDYTMTLPDHTCMLTGRPVAPDPNLPLNAYHGWTLDSYPSEEMTLHNSGNPNLDYVSSVFDVAHDHGLRTCMYAGKSKFALYKTSYDGLHGGVDRVGPDNGRNKIDRVTINDYDSETLVSEAIADFDDNLCDFTFLHIPETDSIGHNTGWGTPTWLAEVDTIDNWLRELAQHTILAPNQRWGLIVTADHGGDIDSHSDNENPWNFTIPFIAVGPNFTPGSDLYELASMSRRNPGERQLRYSEPWQPIRNGDAGNVALGMLGLPAIPGSIMRGLVVPQ